MKRDILRKKTTRAIAIILFLSPANPYATAAADDAVSGQTAAEDASDVESRAHDAAQSRARAQESVNALSVEIQALKQSVIALNKDLRVLEEDLLFPANTQLNVFLSMDVGKFFTLESVKLKLNGKVVSSHVYSDREIGALARSGIHRLHMGNLSVGEHQLSAFFTGIGPNGREYKRGTTMKITKESGPKYVELKITDSSMKQQPEFSVRQW